MISTILPAFILLLCAVVAQSSADYTPSQVHIAIAGADSMGMRVSWRTKDKYTADPVALYGPLADQLNTPSTESTSSQYLKNHGFHHSALIPSTECGSYVFYKVGDGNVWSEVYQFKAPPCDPLESTINVSIFGDHGYLDAKQRPMEVVGIADLNSQWSAQHTRDQLISWAENEDIDFAYHLGDISYADDAFSHHLFEFGYEKVMDEYMDWMEPIASKVPYMVAPGNHESECHSVVCVLRPFKYGIPLSNFTAYNHRWNMPSAESGGSRGANMWYSFDYGPVHFVTINTETDFKGANEYRTGDSFIPWLRAGGFGRKNEYMEWLEADLKKASEDGTRWIVVGGHRTYDVVKECGAVDLFEKYGVAIYFAGHIHSYSRTVFEDDDQLPHYVVAGGAGCDEMGPPKDAVMMAADGTTTIESDRFSAGILTASPTELTWRLYDTENGGVIDEFTVTKPVAKKTPAEELEQAAELYQEDRSSYLK